MDELALGTVVLATNGHGDFGGDFGQEADDPYLGLDPVLADAFAELIDTRMGVIGRVVGSEKEPAGGHAFCIWADAKALTLDVGHIVVSFSEEAAVVGVVDEPRRYSDVQSFLDDYFDRLVEGEIAELQATKRPEILVFTVRTLATRHLRADVESRRPPLAGPVWFATEAAIRLALDTAGFTGFELPALLHTNGNYARDEAGEIVRDEAANPLFQRTPILLDSDYLMGPEAGHANWTGQSGLATKTSHAVFLISSAFHRMRTEGKSVAALMFNVKGSDLLWLDKPAMPDDEALQTAYEEAGGRLLRRQDLDDYASFGLEPEPFANLRIFATFRPGLEPGEGGGGYGGPIRLASLLGREGRTRLNTHRTGEHETSNVFPISWPIERLLWMPHRVFDRMDLDDKMFGLIADLREPAPASLNALLAKLEDAIAEAETASDSSWRGHHRFTIIKLRNRLKGLTGKFGGLLAEHEIDPSGCPAVDERFADQELRVVDIAHCNSNVQEALVSSVINEIWKKAERNELGVEKLIVFVDELNKYAPGGGEGGLRDVLVDIAARGRHLNVVLFGAQQFRSKVDDEILGNCGTSFYGRVGDEEIVNAAYRSLSETVKTELLGLPKGRLLVRHAHFRAPLFGTFPLQPCATGTVGQRVYNAEGVVRTQHAGDPLHAVLRDLMGAAAPDKGAVRRACDGLDAEAVRGLAGRLKSAVAVNTHSRSDPWRTAQHQLANLRRRG